MKNRTKTTISIFALLLAIAAGLIFFKPKLSLPAQENPSEEMLEGRVIEITDEDSYTVNGIQQFQQKLEIAVTKGSKKGQEIMVETGDLPTANSRPYRVGDKLLISAGTGMGSEEVFYIVDYVRRTELMILFITFIVCAVAVGRIWGITSLVGMAFSFFIIFTFVLPQIIAGSNAVLSAVIGASLIIPVTFSLSHGIQKKTLIAGIGTILTLIITGLLAAFFVNLTHLTGFASEEAGFLLAELSGAINMKGILLAGIIIAALGVLDDITISQASVVQELFAANPELKSHEIFARAMKVGRDHIASLINTLVLIYTGASLPLLLLFINKPRPFFELINYEMIADEVVRTLVGSIGLILAVPITTALAAYYFGRRSSQDPIEYQHITLAEN